MKITNEQVGKFLLLWIVFFNFLKLIGMLIWKVSDNYKLRKGIARQILNCVLYSIFWIAIWMFTPISIFFKENFVGYLFNKDLKDGAYSALVIIFILFASIPLYLYGAKLIKDKFLISLKNLSPIIAIVCLFWYYRFFSNDYQFYGIVQGEIGKILKILDFPVIVLMIYSGIVCFYSIFQEKKVNTYNSMMVVDSPLLNKENDEYDRSQFYKSIINTLSGSIGQKDKALSIGVVNKWGEGKTSFIGFLKKEFLKDNNTIFIEFNPWYSSSSSNLTMDFFQTLDQELSKYIYTGSLLRKYAKSLTNIDSPLNPFKYLPDNWVSEKSHDEYFKDINALLLKLNKRIIVTIDDLDRLDNKEVFAVFQVIRNSANFDKMVFITPFDKEYVVHSLSELKIHKPEDYTKKIFDVEFSLPPISKFHLIRAFEIILKEALQKLNKLKAESKKELSDQIEQILIDSGLSIVGTVKYTVINKVMFENLRNKRDLIRFVNSLVINLRDSHEIVYLPDVFILELIKHLDVGFFRKLFETKDWITKEDGSNNFLENNVLNDPELEVILTAVNDENMQLTLKELLRNLVAMPLSNDFNSGYSFHYSSNYYNYHQFKYDGVSNRDIEDLFLDQ
ncbi:KAP family P-loop NTPase fold protein [Sphingobacterium kitahiroshimense]|uniref:P-loop NTPase fold protein n=1 Tax=Sphingobacterium kitahiroshimense TaxID=470446 RepID=A0ABV0BW35_9SPHI